VFRVEQSDGAHVLSKEIAMQRPTARSQIIRVALIAHLGISGCGGSETTSSASNKTIQIVSGDAQSSTVATRLSASLVVRVIDASGATVAGAPVSWAVSTNGGSLAAASSITNDAGVTTNDWTMGVRAGDYTVTAGLSGSASPVTFRGSALAGPVAGLEQVSSLERFGAIGLTLGAPLTVKAADQFHNATRGTVVTWTVTAGQGSVDAPSSATNADGVASTIWTLGSSAGTNLVAASIPGFAPVSFSATAFIPGCVVPSDGAAVRSTSEVSYTYLHNGQFKIRTANIYAPEFGPSVNHCPLVVVLPGGCQNKDNIDWAGPVLAARGYVVMTASVQATGTVADALLECTAAARGAIDFLLSPGNPYEPFSDGTRIGAVGWSAGADAVSGLPASESRIGAIVAWDNLVGYVAPPRGPALGIAAELCTTTPQDCGSPGYSAWRNAGLPTMQVVLASTVHASFGSFGPNDSKPFIAYYTWNWFDRWLKQDPTATTRLLTSSIVLPGFDGLATPRADVLSASAASMVFFDGRDCTDLRSGCP
jgi:hypothetical protein